MIVIYKNNRKYSNIKFIDIKECKKFIRFYEEDCDKVSGCYFDFYEYPSGKFVKQLVVKNINKGLVFTKSYLEKTPRNKRFIKK